jgi:phage I-like protein
VDIVSAPAATNGLFFSENNNNQSNKMNKDYAVLLGLPETATEDEIKLALSASKDKLCKYEADEKKRLEAEAKKLAEANEGEGEKKKFSTLEKQVLELSASLTAINANAEAAKASAHKAEIEGIKAEAGRDGKVIPVSDESLIKLSIGEIKDMVSKLPKGQLKLNRGVNLPTGKDNKPLDKNSPEFKAFCAEKQREGALALGQRMISAVNLNQ